MNQYPNTEFMRNYLAGNRVEAILPFEKTLIEHHLGLVAVRSDAERAERIEVREQSGDNWHDGAFNDLDREHRRIMQEAGRLRSAHESMLVDYPEEDQQEASIGSKLTIHQGTNTRTIYLVGFSFIHDRSLKPTPVGVESPIAAALIGKKAGTTASVRSLPAAMREVQILEIDQTFRPYDN